MKFAKHLAGYAPVKLIATLCAFGGIYLYTRLLGPGEYGRYALMFSVLALMHMISLTWVEAASYRFGGSLKSGAELPDHFKTATTLLIISLGGALLLTAGLLVITWHHPQYRVFVPYIAVLMPLNALIKIAMEAHKAQQNVTRYMRSAAAKMLIGFIVGVVLAWQTGLGAVAPFAGLLTGAVILALFEGRWVLKQAVAGQTDRRALKAWAVYGIPTSLALGLDILLSSADRFLIAYFMDEAAVGSYAAGYGVADKTVLMVVSWVAMAGSPLLMEAYERGKNGAVGTQARQFATLLLLTGMPVAAGIAIVAEPLADAMIGESLREQAKTIIPWIAMSGLLNGLLVCYFSESFHLVKKTRVKALLMLIPLALNIGLNILLIPRFQLMGAVAATVISYFTAVMILAAVGRTYVRLPIPIKDMVLITLACAAMYPVSFIRTGAGPWADLFIMAGLGAVIYLTVIWILNVAQTRDWVQSMIKTRRRS